MFRLQNRLSRSANLTISNSHAGRNTCIRHGFSSDKVIVIPNGIDTTRFRPDEKARESVRAEWGIGAEEILIGHIARLHPVKDHVTFLKGAAQLAGERPDVRFVCVGDGDVVHTARLKNMADGLGLGGRLIWAGMRPDMESVYAALDLCTSTSLSEAFPNVVSEAMACGVPCVVTDVGDCASLVGNTGVIVAPSSPEAVAEGWRSCLLGQYRDMGMRARERVVAEYGKDRLVERTTRAIQALSHAGISKLR